MTQGHNEQSLDAMIAYRVRQNVMSAGIAAALLLYFGFGALALVDAQSLAEKGHNAFIYVLRVGGILSLIAAFLCMTGKLPALAYDGVTTLLTGVAMAICVVLMMSEYAVFLNAIIAVLFVVAGFRDTRAWLGLLQMKIVQANKEAGGSSVSDRESGESMAVTKGYVTMPVIDRKPPETITPPPNPEPPISSSPPVTIEPPQAEEPIADEPAPDGFLASFAPEQDDDKKND